MQIAELARCGKFGLCSDRWFCGGREMKRAIGCAIALVVAGYVGILVHYHWFTPEGRMMWTPQGRAMWKRIVRDSPDAVLKDWVGPVKSRRMDAENILLHQQHIDWATETIERLGRSIASIDASSKKPDDRHRLLQFESEMREARRILDISIDATTVAKGPGCYYAYAGIRTRGEDTAVIAYTHGDNVRVWVTPEKRNMFVGYFNR